MIPLLVYIVIYVVRVNLHLLYLGSLENRQKDSGRKSYFWGFFDNRPKVFEYILYVKLQKHSSFSFFFQFLIVPLKLVCWGRWSNDLHSATEHSNMFSVVIAIVSKWNCVCQYVHLRKQIANSDLEIGHIKLQVVKTQLEGGSNESHVITLL